VPQLLCLRKLFTMVVHVQVVILYTPECPGCSSLLSPCMVRASEHKSKECRYMYVSTQSLLENHQGIFQSGKSGSQESAANYVGASKKA